MEGIVDIYMPDFKYWDEETSRRYLKSPRYPAAARAALKEMHRQEETAQLPDRSFRARDIPCEQREEGEHRR